MFDRLRCFGILAFPEGNLCTVFLRSGVRSVSVHAPPPPPPPPPPMVVSFLRASTALVKIRLHNIQLALRLFCAMAFPKGSLCPDIHHVGTRRCGTPHPWVKDCIDCAIALRYQTRIRKLTSPLPVSLSPLGVLMAPPHVADVPILSSSGKNSSALENLENVVYCVLDKEFSAHFSC